MESLLINLVSHIGNNMPELHTVDEDYGQLEAGKDTYPVIFPAVLVDVQDTRWENVAELKQLGVCTVNVRLVIDCYDDTHHGAPDAAKYIGEREELRRKLHGLLQGFACSEKSSGLIRIASRFYTAGNGIKVYESTYTTEVYEAVRELSLKKEKPRLTVRASE